MDYNGTERRTTTTVTTAANAQKRVGVLNLLMGVQDGDRRAGLDGHLLRM